MTITYDKQVLIKRGNTASVSTYVGPLGELVLDTETNQVYVHDGVTVGGTIVGDGNTGGGNLVGYATEVYVDNAVANVSVDLTGYATESYVTTQISNLVAAAPAALDTLNELAAALSDDENFSTTVANSLASLQSNINSLTNSVYTNSNVAAYLPTYNGNIKISNVTFSDLSVQRTAYTGQSWRTLLESNLQTKPTWLAYVPDGSKPTVDVNFGFDSGGMWFKGNANDQHAYPIRTNVSFYDTDATEIVATFDYDTVGDDHGIAIFNSATTQPFWRFGTDASRIAWQVSTATPELRGQSTSSVAGAPVLEINNTYTVRMVYDPLAETNQVTVELYQGTGTAGTLLDTRTINETLPAGAYEVGFDADQDNLSLKSYFTALTIKTLTNAVFNDIEVVNNLTVNGTVTYPGDIVQSYQDATNCPAAVETVIYTATRQYQHAIKLFVMVEGSEDESGTWQTQACDVIAVQGFVDNIVHVTVYGRTYSGIGPLATFDGQWNATTNRIEITCIPTHPTNSVVASVHAIEMTTND